MDTKTLIWRIALLVTILVAAYLGGYHIGGRYEYHVAIQATYSGWDGDRADDKLSIIRADKLTGMVCSISSYGKMNWCVK